MKPPFATSRLRVSLIIAAMTGQDQAPPARDAGTGELASRYGETVWIAGDPRDYDREFAVDLAQLRAFLMATQRRAAEVQDLDRASPTRQEFLARLQGEIARRGAIDVLRHGVKHGPHHLDLFYGTPTPGNIKAEGRYARNRQLDVVRKLLADVGQHGAGRRYLIQHSAGSGKSKLHRLSRLSPGSAWGGRAWRYSTPSSWSPTGASLTNRSRPRSASSLR